MRFTNTVRIERPVAEVFDYLADFENLPRWNYAIHETRKVGDGPVGVGSRYVQTRTIPTHSEETFEVTAFEPHRRLAIRGRFGPFPAESTYDLASDGDLTTLANTMELHPPRPVSLVAPLASHGIKSAVAANLETLRRILERAR